MQILKTFILMMINWSTKKKIISFLSSRKGGTNQKKIYSNKRISFFFFNLKISNIVLKWYEPTTHKRFKKTEQIIIRRRIITVFNFKYFYIYAYIRRRMCLCMWNSCLFLFLYFHYFHKKRKILRWNIKNVKESRTEKKKRTKIS